jgi:hypothetical protein
MQRIQVSMAAIASLALGGALMNIRPTSAQQQPTCLHGQNEAPDQLARRQQALRLTRHINTLQAAAHGRTRAYQAIATLPVVEPVPQQFVLNLASDGASYAFSVKDTLDPCRFGYFSDQDGLIYVGQVIR